MPTNFFLNLGFLNFLLFPIREICLIVCTLSQEYLFFFLKNIVIAIWFVINVNQMAELIIKLKHILGKKTTAMDIIKNSLQRLNEIKRRLEFIYTNISTAYISLINFLKEIYKMIFGRDLDGSYILDSITIASLLMVLVKITLKLFHYNLPPLVAIVFFYLLVLLSLKCNFIYYVREEIYKILSKTRSKKCRFSETFKDMYYEEDFWNPEITPRLPRGLQEQYEHRLNYKKDVNRKYLFTDLTETLFEQFIRNTFIFFIYIRLSFLASPMLFRILKVILGYCLIFNKLALISYLLSIIVITARLVFHVNAFDMSRVRKIYDQLNNHSYHKENPEPILKISPTLTNARVCYFWLAVSYTSREMLYEGASLDPDCIGIYTRMINYGYWTQEMDEQEFLETEKTPNYVLWAMFLIILFNLYYLIPISTLMGYTCIEQSSNLLDAIKRSRSTIQTTNGEKLFKGNPALINGFRFNNKFDPTIPGGRAYGHLSLFSLDKVNWVLKIFNLSTKEPMNTRPFLRGDFIRDSTGLIAYHSNF